MTHSSLIPVSTYKLPPLRPFSLASAANALGVDRKVVSKAMESGLIPDLQPATIERISQIPLVAELPNGFGGYVQALRMGPKLDCAMEEDDRLYQGYDVSMTPDQIEAASRGWWRAPGRDSIFRERFFLVIRASFIVGLMEMPLGEISDQIESLIDDEGHTRYRYPAKLVAYRGSDGSPVLIDANARNADLAMSVVGLRRLGGGGGAFTATKPLEARR